MTESDSAEFDIWLKEANRDLDDAIAQSVDVDAALLQLKLRAYSDAVTAALPVKHPREVDETRAVLAGVTDTLIQLSLRPQTLAGEAVASHLRYVTYSAQQRLSDVTPSLKHARELARRRSRITVLSALPITAFAIFSATYALWEWRSYAASLAIILLSAGVTFMSALVVMRAIMKQEDLDQGRKRKRARLALIALWKPTSLGTECRTIDSDHEESDKHADTAVQADDDEASEDRERPHLAAARHEGVITAQIRGSRRRPKKVSPLRGDISRPPRSHS